MVRLRRFTQRSISEKLLLFRVTLLFGTIRLGLAVLPFSILRSILDWAADARKSESVSNDRYQEQILWAASVASRYVVRDKPCLTQALAVQYLMRRRGLPAELRIGVMKDKQKMLQAHAWVVSDDEVVIGGSPSELKKFTPLSRLDIKPL